MRKIISQFFMVVILLSFISCSGGSEAIHFNNADSEPNIAEIEAFEENLQDAEPHDADIYDAFTLFDERYPHENAPMPTDLHPFAAALSEYIAAYDGVVRAYLATLDDAGTMGVLTTRPTTRFRVWDEYPDKYFYDYGISSTLFYIQDGELFQIDVSSWWIFVAGRYNRLMVRLYGHTHIVEIIYKLENGRLETSTRLEYFSDEYLLLGSDYDIAAKHIAERDARAAYAAEKYGLVALPPLNFGHMQNTECQTAQILAMTMDCVPRLAQLYLSPQTHFDDFYELVESSDYIVLVSSSMRNLSVREIFKSEVGREGLSARISQLNTSLFVEFEYYLIFLRSVNGEVEFVNQHQAIFRVCCCYWRDGFPAVHEGGSGFNIYPAQISALRRERLEGNFAAPPLEFEARRVQTCCFYGRDSFPSYPAVIKSMDCLADYLSYYEDFVLRYTRDPDSGALFPHFFADEVFGEHTADFFEENFMIVLFMGGESSSIGHRIEAVLENGDIHVSVRGWLGGMTDDVTGFHIIIYVCNSYIPENFNVRTVRTWF